MAIKRWILLLALIFPAIAGAQTTVFNCGPGGTAVGATGCTVQVGTGESFFSQNALNSGFSGGTYTSGITATGTTGQTCALTITNGGGSGATANIALTGTNTIASGAALVVTNYGTGFTGGPTAASVAAGTASCSGTAVISGTFANQFNLVPSGQTHTGQAINFTTKANIQAFQSEFQFVANGWTVAFVVQNNTNNNASGGHGAQFSAGAGCEAGFFQIFDETGTPPNFLFALDLSSFDNLTLSGGFTFSSAQVYQPYQSPCIPNDSQPFYYVTNKISTSPVPLTSPANAINTFTGDTYDAKVGYDGTTFSICMSDITLAVGSCSSSTSGTGTFFQQSWANVNIPSIVGANTAFVGLTEGTGDAATTNNLLVPLFKYVVETAPSQQSISTYTSQSNSGGTPVAAPTFSPVAGTYSGTQTVTVSSSTSGSYNCFVLSSAFPSFLPQTDNAGGCVEGTVYTGPVSVPSTQTLYAMSGIAGRNVLGSVTGLTGGSGSGTVFLSNFNQNCVGSTATVTLASGAFSSAVITNPGTSCLGTAGSGSSNPTSATCANGTATCPGSTATVATTTTAIASQMPSNVSNGLFTITGGGAATAPSCTPTSGSSSSPISVTCTNANGGTTIMCFTEDASTPVTAGNGTTCTHGTALTGSSNTITISSTVPTLEVVAGTSTLTDSTAFSSGPYTITTGATLSKAAGVSGVGVKIQ